MASPPFDINASVPADNDIVSQFPGIERTFRDVSESWLLVNHNVNGRHSEVDLDNEADPGSGIAAVTQVWSSSTGNAAGELKKRNGLGNVEWLGVPPGAVTDYAGASAPEGWLLCYGQAVSRTTYARLFDAIGTTFGVGDGSTTFAVPDARDRATIGKGNMGGTDAGLVTTAGSGIDGATLGATGGTEKKLLDIANVPNVTLTVAIPSGQGSHQHNNGIDSGGGSGVPLQPVGAANHSRGSTPAVSDLATLPAMTGTTSSINGGVTQTTVATMPPSLVLNKIIKT